MRKYIIILITLIYACGEQKKSNNTRTQKVEEKAILKATDVATPETILAEPKESIQKKIENNKLVVVDSTSVYVNMLKKIDDSKDYSLPVNFKSSISESAQEDFHAHSEKYTSDLIAKNSEYTRYKIEDSIANTYLEVSNLHAIIVFDELQEVLDTLYLKNYEYFSDQLESHIIATYSSTNIVDEDKDYICMSVVNANTTKSKYKYEQDDAYKNEILAMHKLKPRHVYGYDKIIRKKDTFSYVSFDAVEGEEVKRSFYLFKNKKLIDSIINDCLISKMIPVPTLKENEAIFIADKFIPDTDAFWTSLIGIDINTNKLNHYKYSNRVSLE